MKKIHFILVLSILLVACKGAKTASTTAAVNNRSSKEVIKRHYKGFTEFSTLKSTLKIRYVDEDRDDLITADLRIQKDQKIWISAKLAFITLAKIMITPDKVSYYNKLDKTYFEGDFSIISKWLGTELNFEQVQNLLLAQSIFNLKDQKHRVALEPDSYLLSPKKQQDLFEYFIRIEPSHFKTFSQEIAQPKELRVMTVDYPQLQEKDQQIFPKKINITALEKTKETKIEIEYRNVSLNQNLRFPFKRPNNYKELALE